MMKIALCLFSILLLSLSTSGVARISNDGAGLKSKTQTSPVYLRGRIVKVRLARQDVHSIVFKLELNLQLVNVSTSPVILLKRLYWLGATTIAGSSEEAKAHKYMYASGGWPSVSGGSEWGELRQRLNQENPPSALTRTLALGESLQYETEATLYNEKAGSVDKTSLPWEVIREASPAWLQVSIEVWPINVEPKVDPENLEFGKTLQNRWQQFGKLQLERLTSEPMQLSFPPSP